MSDRLPPEPDRRQIISDFIDQFPITELEKLVVLTIVDESMKVSVSAMKACLGSMEGRRALKLIKIGHATALHVLEKTI